MMKTPRGGVWGHLKERPLLLSGKSTWAQTRRFLTDVPRLQAGLTAKNQPWKDQTHELWGSFFPHPQGQGWGHIKNTHTHLTDGTIFPITAAASYWSDLKVRHSSWKARNVSERHREMKSSSLSEKCNRASVSLCGKLTVGGVLARRERSWAEVRESDAAFMQHTNQQVLKTRHESSTRNYNNLTVRKHRRQLSYSISGSSAPTCNWGKKSKMNFLLCHEWNVKPKTKLQ